MLEKTVYSIVSLACVVFIVYALLFLMVGCGSPSMYPDHLPQKVGHSAQALNGPWIKAQSDYFVNQSQWPWVDEVATNCGASGQTAPCLRDGAVGTFVKPTWSASYAVWNMGVDSTLSTGIPVGCYLQEVDFWPNVAKDCDIEPPGAQTGFAIGMTFNNAHYAQSPEFFITSCSEGTAVEAVFGFGALQSNPGDVIRGYVIFDSSQTARLQVTELWAQTTYSCDPVM